MPKVNMPRGSWESVLMALEMLIKQGYLLDSEHKEIQDQVYAQEY